MSRKPTKNCPNCQNKIHNISKQCRPCSVKKRKTIPTDRFWKYVEKTDNCWIWNGARSRANYGVMQSGNGPKTIYAHRFSYQLHNGEIAKGKLICHVCDNPPCVNPKHLREGTHLDNNRDRAMKGRSIYGEKRWNTKLKKEFIPIIKQLYNDGTEVDSMAISYGVSPTTIYDVVRGRTWKHIP